METNLVEGASLDGSQSPGVSLETPTLADVFAAVVEDFQPVGVIEQTWCRDIAVNSDYANRLRRIRQSFLAAARAPLLEKMLLKAVDLYSPASAAHQKQQFAALQAATIVANRNNPVASENSEYREARRSLNAIGFEMRNLEASVYFEHMVKMESIERLIVVTDARRDSIIRDLDRRRQTMRRVELSNADVA